jgi:hypothetical protein
MREVYNILMISVLSVWAEPAMFIDAIRVP